MKWVQPFSNVGVDHTGETTPIERIPRVADGGTPRRWPLLGLLRIYRIRSRGPNKLLRNHSLVDSTSEAGGQGSPIQTAGAEGRSILHGESPPESTLPCTSGSSRASCPSISTTEGEAGTPHTLPSTLSPNLPVLSQTSRGEEGEAGAGEPAIDERQPRAAAMRQRGLMQSLLNDNLL